MLIYYLQFQDDTVDVIFTNSRTPLVIDSWSENRVFGVYQQHINQVGPMPPEWSCVYEARAGICN